ncbi:hypothetical protein GCM10027043_53000 [Ferruginibacter profundus]
MHIIDSIFYATKHKTKLRMIGSRDSTLFTHYFVNRKSNDLMAVDMYKRLPNSKHGEWRYIYYFSKGELIKLFIHLYTKRNKYLRETIYFSDGKVIQRQGSINPQYDLEKPLSFLNIFKTNLNPLL